ncbi:MAG: cell division protein SepF [Selenomonadaceae bacterium]|nr:cell division protein SepF [Selenomonadaceae bacterium]
MWRRTTINDNLENQNEQVEENSPYKKSEITTIKPKDINDAQTIAKCLRDKVPVIVNFEETDEGEMKRVLDFISGTTYAVAGQMRQVSNKVFIFAPDNITLESPDQSKKW